MEERKPILLAVDDDRDVLRAVERDLKARYARDYAVVTAASGAEALDVVDRVVMRGDEVALLLVDQRMPGMTGTEFLGQSVGPAPEAKRVLLTAYADTTAAITAINDIGLDHYLMKPWHPPEERLYPVLDEALDDWRAARARAGPEGTVKVIGRKGTPEWQAICDLLSNNHVPRRLLDVHDDEAQRLLRAASLEDSELPVVFLPDGEHLVAPTIDEVAPRVGLSTEPELGLYDLVVVGGGPAGLAAAVYGASEGLRTVVIERAASGGQAAQSSRIENYLGFPSGLSGDDLARRATTQARRFGAELLTAQEAVAIDVDGQTRKVILSDGDEVAALTVLLAMGVSYRRLHAKGAEALTGRGIWYGTASTGDAMLLDGADAFIVGGANSAGQAALHLSKRTNVTILYRGDSLSKSMSSYLVERIESSPDIDVRLNTNVVETHGDDRLEAITVSDGNGSQRLPAAALFVFVGAEPHTDWLGDGIARSDRGFVLTGPEVLSAPKGGPRWPEKKREPLLLETSLPGVFAAGDVRDQSIKRVASAVGEGSMAVLFVHQYLKEV
jgi:thioredoxin reductase (NADPH)